MFSRGAGSRLLYENWIYRVNILMFDTCLVSWELQLSLPTMIIRFHSENGIITTLVESSYSPCLM